MEFSDQLYNNSDLMEAVSRALGEEGIFVAKGGEADEINDPTESLYADGYSTTLLNGLQQVGFKSIHHYEERGRLAESWSFILAVKGSIGRSNWFMNEAEMQLRIQKRAKRTKNGESPFRFFDGASMMQY